MGGYGGYEDKQAGGVGFLFYVPRSAVLDVVLLDENRRYWGFFVLLLCF